jgi:hypothetical protein
MLPAAASWVRLWYGPWEGAHPAWLVAPLAPPWWPSWSERSAAARRLAYPAWCEHFDLDTTAPAGTFQHLAQSLGPLPPDAAHLQRMQRYLGMVAAASHPGFARAWLAHGKALGNCALPPQWRAARGLSVAKGLSLVPDGSQPARDAWDVDLLGLAMLRLLIGAIAEPLWWRLRWRIDPRLVMADGIPSLREDAVPPRSLLHAWHQARIVMARPADEGGGA